MPELDAKTRTAASASRRTTNGTNHHFFSRPQNRRNSLKTFHMNAVEVATAWNFIQAKFVKSEPGGTSSTSPRSGRPAGAASSPSRSPRRCERTALRASVPLWQYIFAGHLQIVHRRQRRQQRTPLSSQSSVQKRSRVCPSQSVVTSPSGLLSDRMTVRYFGGPS